MLAKIALFFIAACAGLSAQSCAVSIPGASGAPISTAGPVQLSLTVSGYPTASKAVTFVDYVRWGTVTPLNPEPTTPNDPRIPFTAPWTTMLSPSLFGDGNAHVVYAKIFDELTNEVIGSPLCTTPTVTYGVRSMGMSNQSLSSSVTSSPGAMTMLTFNGDWHQEGEVYVDGQSMKDNYNYCGRAGATLITGGWTLPSFDPSCYTNSQHLVMMSTNLSYFTDPSYQTETFSGSVSGSTISITGHYLSNGSVVTLTTAGTLPLPLTTGAEYFGSAQASASVASGLITVTLASAPAFTITTGTRVFARQINANPQLGEACDGYYSSIATVTSQTVFSLTAPTNCPTGLSGTSGFNVVLNPWFVIYVDANDFQLSQTATVNSYGDVIPGSAQTFSAGSGTATISLRLRSSKYGHPDQINQQNLGNTNAPNYVMGLMTFNTGSGTPMEVEPAYSTIFNYAGQTDTFAWRIKNTDLTFTSATCASPAVCTYEDIGTVTGQMSFNATTQVITYNPNSSWTNPYGYPVAWGQITVNCNAACAGNSGGLPPVTTLIENCGGSPCTTPHFSRTGPILTQFTPGKSFFLLNGGPEIGPEFQSTTGWPVAFYKNSFINSSYYGTTAGDTLQDANSTSCGAWSGDAQMTQAESFAVASGSTLRFDMEQFWVGSGNTGAAVFNAIMANLGFNRQSCFTTLINHFVSSGLYSNLGIDDEFSGIVGTNFAADGTIGGLNFTNVVVSGCPGACLAVFTIQNMNNLVLWNQTTGLGDVIIATGATTDSFLNGVFLPEALATSTTSMSIGGGTQSFTIQTGLSFLAANQRITVASGSNSFSGTITSYNSLTGAIVVAVTTTIGSGTYASWNITTASNWAAPCTDGCVNGTYTSTTDPGFALVLNPFYAQSYQNVSFIPNNSYNICISWSGGACGANSNFGPTLTVSGSTLTIPWTGVGSAYNGTITVRVQGSVNGLNIVGPATVSANSLSLTYPGGTGGAAPTAGSYNSGNDSGLYLTVDPGLPVNAARGWISIISAVTGHPVLTPSTLGSFYTVSSPSAIASLVSFEGYPNAETAFEYISTPPGEPMGIDASVHDIARYCAAYACATLPWQSAPAMDFVAVGNNFHPYAQNVVFTPATDRPNEVFMRAENIQVQMRSDSALGTVGHEFYSISTNLAAWFNNCCGPSLPGTGGAPQASLLPFNEPILSNGLEVANLTYKQSERWELNAPCNHQYFGPFFSVDCHQSYSTGGTCIYGSTSGSCTGNEVSITCTSEMPYGQFPVNTLAISGGSLWLRQADGNTIWLSAISGNPSTLTREWCQSPGLQSSIIAEPPGLEVVDMVSFGPLPASPPGGATKLIVRPVYTTLDAIDNQGFDCTSGCRLPFLHWNSPANYQVLWMNSSYQPVGPFNPPLNTIPSQGFY